MKYDIIKGSGGGSPPEPHTTVEDPNTLQSKAVARIVEILCEGEIEGPYEDCIEKSMYFDQTEVKDNYDAWNFSGVTVDLKTGLPDQDHIPGFPSVENEVSVNTEIVKEVGPVVKTISDINTDDVRVLVSVPRLTKSTDEGDLKGTTVKISIMVKPEVGIYQNVKQLTITGKCISLYQRAYLIDNISQYGDGPWEVKLTRLTDDSGSVRLSNKIYWTSYTSIINEKMIYPNTALIGLTVDSEQFGNKIPSRSYDIKGLKVKVPDNYTVATRTYTGEWSGTFKTEWCDNPAWVYYDLLTNSRYGMGLNEDKVDKWALYTASQYCDTYIDDGYGGTEPRFVCNLIINVRKEAIHVLNMLTSVFRGMPLWASGLATITQDKPKDSAKLVTNANVINGLFSYEGSGIKERHTVAKVTWNDINDFCRKQVEYVENTEGISRYGWKPVDVYAYGTTSRGQAHRVGKWILDSNIHETEIVNYKASFDHADLLPGDVIDLSDSHYNGGIEHRYSGRLVSSTSNTVTIDNPITIAGGKTYTLTVVLPDGSLDEDIEIVNDTGEATLLELGSSFSTQPQDHAIWMVTVSDLTPRKFRIINNIEDEDNLYSITALYYDEDKFARVEEGIYLDEIAESAIPIGAMLPPTSLAAEEFQYIEGGAQLYGCILSWIHPDEPRKIYYDIQSRSEEDGIYIQQGDTVNNSYDIRPVTSGIYDYRVRTVGAGGVSSWGYLTEFTIDADSTLCSGVENLQVYGGGTTFSGGDCEIEWDDSDCHLLKDYKVEVCRTNDTILRTEYVIPSNYIYTHQMNTLDTTGSPIREIKFKVYVQNIYGKAGPSETLVAENPIPDMAGLTPTLTQRYGGITIDWDNITPADNDMWKYKVYGDSFTPPTSFVYQCDAETTFFHWFGLDVGTLYYIQIEPYDYFGAGVKSDIVGEEPVLIPDINIDYELTTSIEMSDSDSNSAATLAKLYDRNKISDGVSYTVSGTGDTHIEYRYAVEDIFDRTVFYMADANARVYVAYSSNGTDWTYLKAEADHTLDGDELLVASNQSDAQTNYLQTTTGTNVAIFPAMIAGRYMRLYMTGSYTTTIYELIFYREVVAEMVVTDTLAALSANCGTLTAGILQSSTYGADKGILVDLDNDRMILGGSSDPVMDIDADAGTGTFKGVFTFESGTDGYAQITDKPTDLGDINSTEGTKLTGIDEGADVTGDNTAAAVTNQEIYRISGYAYGDTDHPITGVIRDENGTEITGLGSNPRSYTLSIYDRSTMTWDSHTTYDVYGGAANALALKNALTALDNTKIVVIVGAHAPSQNRTTNDLPDEIYRCGGSRTVFLNENWAGSHPTYILVGVPGMGEGAGIELFAPTAIGWLDTTVIFKNGNIVGVGATPTDIARGADVTDYTDTSIANAVLENNLLTISRPIGASFSGGSSETGVIRIKLPQSWSDTMLKFVVDVYEFTTGLSFSLDVSGYNSISASAWSSTTANLTGSTAADNRVRFAYDDSKCCVYIGETTSNWTYLKVSVRDFQAGLDNYAIDDWDDGWAIDVTNTIVNISSTISDALIDAKAIRDQGDLAIQDRTDLDYTDGADVTDYTDTSIANALLENNILTISRPIGASFAGGALSTGAIKIRLPQSWVGTMLKLTIDVYEYTSNISFSLELSGYISGAVVWGNTTANLTGSTAADNRVRFGHDGTKCCIYIGETTSEWAYIKTSVRDFQAGNDNYALDQWNDGWEISVTTSIGTITSDISDALIDANNTNNVGSLPATTVQGWAHTSDTTKIDGGDIYTNTVTATQINVANLSAINADMGTITAGTITIPTSGWIKGGQTDYSTGTGFFLGYSGAAYKFSFGDATNYITWDGSVLTIGGKIIYGDNVASAVYGDQVNAASNMIVSAGGTTYLKVKEIQIGRAGNYRLKFYLKSLTSTTTGYGRVYKNGVAIGAAKSKYGTSWSLKTEDISGWAKGDLCQLYVKGSGASYYGAVKQFHLCATDNFGSISVQDESA